jgi:hypothetical protein
MERIMEFSQNLKRGLPYDSVIPLLDRYPKEMKSYSKEIPACPCLL